VADAESVSILDFLFAFTVSQLIASNTERNGRTTWLVNIASSHCGKVANDRVFDQNEFGVCVCVCY